MIDPKNLNLSTLPWLPLQERSAFPKEPAIYFAIDTLGEIQYIGRSINPRQRWSQHHRYEQLAELGGVRVAYLFVDAPELLPQIESALIGWFDPPLNVVGQTIAQSSSSDTVSRIAKLREQKNLTQRQIAEAVGVTDQTVSNWERGIYSPRLTLRQTIKLCKVVDRTVEELADLLEPEA